MKGIWLCRQDGELLPLGPPGPRDGDDSVLRRIALARNRPEDSFIWWAEARKVTSPDVVGLRRAVSDLFELAWDERVSRINPQDGTSAVLPDGRPGVRIGSGKVGCVMLGPSMPLPEGTYQFAVDVSWSEANEFVLPVARLEVLAQDELLDSAVLVPPSSTGTASLVCQASIPELRFGVQVRLIATGLAELTAPLALRLTPDPWR
jgi:hypothetical protein